MGDPDLWINYGRDSQGAPRWPGLGNADWSSQAFDGNYDIKSIYNPELGEYFIGIQAFQDSAFTVMAVRSGTSLSMVNGVMYPGQLQGLQYQYYQFYVSPADAPFSSKTLTFSMGTLGIQDPDLYCSDHIMMPNHTLPCRVAGINNTNAVDCSTALPPHEMITYSGEAGELHAGTYYCGVRAYTATGETTYVISAYLSDRQTLQDGEPLADNIAAGQIKYYRLVQQNGANSSDIVVTTQVGENQGRAYLYINRAARGDPDVDGTFGNQADWQSNIEAGWRHQQITIPASECAASTAPCIYNVAVFSPLARGPAVYSIVATSGSGVELITPNAAPLSGYVQLGSPDTTASSSPTRALTSPCRWTLA